MCNTFLVVTLLIITTTYNASLNPPKKPDYIPSMKYQVSFKSRPASQFPHIFCKKPTSTLHPYPVPPQWTFPKKMIGHLKPPRFGFTTL
ncbi:hypothetical protein Gotur_033210 [Gossypium turneri]